MKALNQVMFDYQAPGGWRGVAPVSICMFIFTWVWTNHKTKPSQEQTPKEPKNVWRKSTVVHSKRVCLTKWGTTKWLGHDSIKKSNCISGPGALGYTQTRWSYREHRRKCPEIPRFFGRKHILPLLSHGGSLTLNETNKSSLDLHWSHWNKPPLTVPKGLNHRSASTNFQSIFFTLQRIEFSVHFFRFPSQSRHFFFIQDIQAPDQKAFGP